VGPDRAGLGDDHDQPAVPLIGEVSHLFLILRLMWTTKKWRRASEEAPACPTCDDDLEHCHGVLVLHADGRVECLEVLRCEGAVVEHDHEVQCDELGCGCIGDEAGLDLGLLAA